MKVLSVTGATIFAGLLTVGLVVWGGKTPDERAAEMVAEMASAAEQMKGQRVHHNVVFDHYEADGKSFTYHYTLTHIKDGKFRGRDKVRIEQLMHGKVCGDAKMKRFLNSDGVVRYAYRDNAGSHLFVLAFDDAICGLAS